MTIRTPDEHAKDISALVSATRDVLNAAASVAGRGIDHFNGTEACVLFANLRDAILTLRDDAPAMKALTSAAIPPSMLR